MLQKDAPLMREMLCSCADGCCCWGVLEGRGCGCGCGRGVVLGLNTEMLGTGGVSRKAGRILGKVASATGGSEACVCCSEQGNVAVPLIQSRCGLCFCSQSIPRITG